MTDKEIKEITTLPEDFLLEKADRLTPITFRFFRGRSGEDVQRKFLALQDFLALENRSAVLRQCIEIAYQKLFGQAQ